MSKQVKGFMTCDSYIDNTQGVIAPIYEISGQSLTYARQPKQYYSTEDPRYSLYTFYQEGLDVLQQNEVNTITDIIQRFVQYVSTNQYLLKNTAVIQFVSNYNVGHVDTPITDMSVSTLVNTGDLIAPDYLSFKVLGIECGIWLDDRNFRSFYPHYDIDIIFPFLEFDSKVTDSVAMLAGIGSFSFVDFNRRIEETKNNCPTTYTAILKIPYVMPNSQVERDVYFAFNQYGSQGNYDYVLKLKLYQHLLDLGLKSDYIEQIFPSILQINEFFITPRWTSMAIPSQVGEAGINSQITRAYDTDFDLDKYLKIYSDLSFLKANSYNVPYDYNNILLTITNGMHSQNDQKDFRALYGKMITITSSHPEFGKMPAEVGRLIVLLESMMHICDVDTSTKLFSRMMSNTSYDFSILNRQGVTYLSVLYGQHRWYMIPKYQYKELEAA